MNEIDFYEVVNIAKNAHTQQLGIDGQTGVIMGKAEEDGVHHYAVAVGDDTFSLNQADVSPTGEKRSREEFYSGESIRVSPEGDYLGSNSSQQNHIQSTDTHRQGGFRDS